MNRNLAKKVADAVLYEGYMLYPYRPSAIKNRQRWTFGILYPPAYHEVGEGTERSGMHSECLLRADAGATVQIQLRFLHLLARQVARISEGRFEPVPSLMVDDQLIESWDEGVERSVEFGVALQEGETRKLGFGFNGLKQSERLAELSGHVLGELSRTQEEVSGKIAVTSEKVHECVWKISLDISNSTDFAANTHHRDQALLRSLLSAHAIMSVNGGEFVSLLDPPDDLRDQARKCANIGNFPVMVGQEGERDGMLCSPIVLYDYPQIAPESGGDFYDATEMDEMLTLRVMTLTNEEKSEVLLADDHARRLLQRTEETAREQLAKTHGAIRGMRPASEDRDGLV